MKIREGDDIWLDDDVLGTVLSISEPFKCGNILKEDGSPVYGREYVVFVEEDDDAG